MACSGNLHRPSGAFVVETTTSVITRRYQDTQTQNANTSGAGQPSRINNLTAFTCLMCHGTSLRPGQIKRLRCSHAFHQSCIDMWLNNNKFCPVCLTPYMKTTRQHQRSKKNRGKNAGHSMENVANLIPSPDVFAVPSFSAMLAGTNENPQLTNIQDTSTSRENHLHNNSFPVGNRVESTGNPYRFPCASSANTALSLFTGTDQGTTSALVQDASTRGEGQTLSRYTPMDMETPMDIDPQTQFNHFSDSSAMPTSPTQSAKVQETRTSREHQLYSILVANRVESTGQLTRSSFTSASSLVTRTYQGNQAAVVKGPSTSEEDQALRRYTQAAVVKGTSTSGEDKALNRYTQAAVVKGPSTSGEDQALSRYTPMDLDTPTEFHFG